MSEVLSPAYEVTWEGQGEFLSTRVRRALSVDEANEYSRVLDMAIARLLPGTGFVWLSNSSGYEPLANRGGHAVYRSILPKVLAEHGLRTSLLDMYEGEVLIEHSFEVTCRAVAHVHHDADKMAIFDGRFGRANERYFSDEDLARDWLLKFL
jgi:hypothetical protein